MKSTLTILAMLFTTCLLAQNPFNVGVMAGYNQTSLSTDISAYSKLPKGGIQAGVFAKLSLSKIFVKPEIYISSQKGELDFEYIPSSTPTAKSLSATQEIKITNANVPLLVGYYLLDAKVVKIGLNAGPVLSMPLSSKVSLNNLEGPEADVPDVSLADISEDNMFGFQAGVGIDVLKFTLDARYNMAGTKLDKNLDLKGNYWFLALGFKFI